jgi:hypothetical protein
MYTLTPAAYAPLQESHPAVAAPSPPQLTTETPAAAAPRTVIEPSSEPSPLVDGELPSKILKPKCPTQAIVDLFNATIPEFPRVVMLTKDRIAKINARWNESDVHQDLGFWAEYFAQVRSSKFLMGEVAASGGSPFRRNFDWLIAPSNFVKVVEGNYNA